MPLSQPQNILTHQSPLEVIAIRQRQEEKEKGGKKEAFKLDPCLWS